MNVRDLLIALVRYAIKGEALDKGAIKESLKNERLATLYKVAKKHDMAHLVAYALEENGLSFEGEAWQAFLNEREQASLRYEMIQADINEIFACFDGEGIAYIPLKGAVIRGYYPESWMRTSCDIDILVREEDLDRATRTLAERCAYKTDYKKTYHDISLYSPFGMHLELHYSIKENEPKYDELLTRAWEFSQKAEGGKHLQTNEFLLFHLAAHMAYHFIGGGCGMRSVLDLWLLDTRAELDREKLYKMLEKAKLVKFYNTVISLGKYWFDNEKNVSQAVLEAEKYILLGGAYGTGKQGAVSKQIKKGGKFRYFWSRIFMPYESLAILYPVIKKHKILTPFCQIARWFGSLFKSKRIAKEIKNVTGADREQIEKTRKLLDDLGL